jgi:hypothetical protein
VCVLLTLIEKENGLSLSIQILSKDDDKDYFTMADSSSPQRLKGILSVTVLNAKSLIKSDWFSENDCYAIISFEPLLMRAKNKKQQTETYQKT